MRCFIAIDIDETAKAAIAELQESLAHDVHLRHGDVKWVSPEALHLTLKFLGETPDSQLVDICRIAKHTAARHNVFNLDLANIGYFGGRHARVLWIGVTASRPGLEALQADLETELDHAGWPKEGRAYSAHLTLCRIKAPSAGRKLVDAIKNFADFEAGTTSVDHLVIYQSELRPQGPRYIHLGRFPLKQ